MRFLVTGGAGFIGFHLSKVLLERGNQVVCLDNFSTGRRENARLLSNYKGFKCVEGEVQDLGLTEGLVANCDVVFNLAASVGVKKIVESPIVSIENNLQSASAILFLSKKYNRRLFMFSTSETYGKSSKIPFEEDGDTVIGPSDKLRWCYATSKLMDDFLSRAYFEEHGTPVTSVRLFNTIGQRQSGDYGMVVPRFMEQALAGKPISVYGDGRQSRCFTDVRDVVTALLLLLNNEASIGELVNIGTQNEISILDLANQIKKITSSSSPIQFVPYQEALGRRFEDMERRIPSTEKLKRMTGFSYQYDLIDTLGWIYEGIRKRNFAPGPSLDL